MNLYMSIALLAFVVLAGMPKITGTGSPIGSIFLAIIWPIVLIMLTYLLIKKYVFKRSGLSSSEVVSGLEILGCALVTGGLMFLSLVYPHNPVVTFLARPF